MDTKRYDKPTTIGIANSQDRISFAARTLRCAQFRDLCVGIVSHS